MEVVPEGKEEAKPQRHNEEEQQGCPDAPVWLLLVLASALLPRRAECPAGAGAPRCMQQRKREVSGQRQRSRESVCLHRLRGTDRARHGAGIPEGNPAGHPHAPAWPGDVAEILVQSKYTNWCHLCHLHRQHREIAARGAAGRVPILKSCVLRAFPGTAERLPKEDAGTLRCGMQKGFFPFHESADVEVIITPVGPCTFPPHGNSDPHVGAQDHTAEGGFIPCVTGTRDPSGTRCIHPSPASATPTLSPDAPQGARGTFRYFPVLAGLQLLALLAMSAAVLWVSVRVR